MDLLFRSGQGSERKENRQDSIIHPKPIPQLHKSPLKLPVNIPAKLFFVELLFPQASAVGMPSLARRVGDKHASFKCRVRTQTSRLTTSSVLRSRTFPRLHSGLRRGFSLSWSYSSGGRGQGGWKDSKRGNDWRHRHFGVGSCIVSSSIHIARFLLPPPTLLLQKKALRIGHEAPRLRVGPNYCYQNGGHV